MSWRATFWRWTPTRAKAVDTVVIFVQVLCGAKIFTEYIGGPRITSGPSMLPRIDASPQLIIEDTLSPRLHNAKNIERGDLITFRAMYDHTKHVCKRVIGLPGDVICVHPERSISVSNSKEDVRDKRCKSGDHRAAWEVQHVIVPKGHIWVAGDNMSNSRDSREFGPIPLGLVRGRVLAKIYPRMEWCKNPISDIN